jgi:hypothetical protein
MIKKPLTLFVCSGAMLLASLAMTTLALPGLAHAGQPVVRQTEVTVVSAPQYAVPPSKTVEQMIQTYIGDGWRFVGSVPSKVPNANNTWTDVVTLVFVH